MKLNLFCMLSLCLPLLTLADESATKEMKEERVSDAVSVEAAEVDPGTEGPEKNPSDKATEGFERYRTIMDRMPFGPDPVGFDPNVPSSAAQAGGMGGRGDDPAALEQQQSEEAQKILASVRVSALNVTPSGKVAVGFVDSSRQPAVPYYLKVGDKRDGWQVKEADAATKKVVLVKDGVEATLALGEGTEGKDAKGGKKGPLAVSPTRSPLLGGLRARPTAEETSPTGGGGGFARLRERRQAQRAEEAAEAANRAEMEAKRKQQEAEEAERKQQEAAEREQQREALLQIQEELRRQREQREAAQAESGENSPE